MNHVTKITKYKNVIMQHKIDKRRTFLKKLLYKIDFEDDKQMILIMKPKKEQNSFDGSTFKLIKTLRTREKIIFKNKEEIL